MNMKAVYCAANFANVKIARKRDWVFIMRWSTEAAENTREKKRGRKEDDGFGSGKSGLAGQWGVAGARAGWTGGEWLGAGGVERVVGMCRGSWDVLLRGRWRAVLCVGK